MRENQPMEEGGYIAMKHTQFTRFSLAWLVVAMLLLTVGVFAGYSSSESKVPATVTTDSDPAALGGSATCTYGPGAAVSGSAQCGAWGVPTHAWWGAAGYNYTYWTWTPDYEGQTPPPHPFSFNGSGSGDAHAWCPHPVPFAESIASVTLSIAAPSGTPGNSDVDRQTATAHADGWLMNDIRANTSVSLNTSGSFQGSTTLVRSAIITVDVSTDPGDDIWGGGAECSGNCWVS